MDRPRLAVLVFAGILWAFWRSGELRFMQAACSGLLGFYLADSGMAPGITDAVGAVFDWISTWQI